jgi:hypothetical protein
MLTITWDNIFDLARVWGATAMVMFGLYKAWLAYLDTEIKKAKEKSVGEAALKRVDADIDLIEKEINTIRESTSDYAVLKILVEKLRDDYKFIMERLFPIKPIQ